MTNQNDQWAALQAEGQSIWLDSISRGSLTGGELQGLIERGLRGETANPTIFEKAISTGSEYDRQVRELVEAGKNADDIYEALLVRDVQMACDLFRPVYDRLDGADGFVSLEVSPRLARNTQGTIEEVRRFWKWVDRPNLMIKIPGTEEGTPAIEQMLYEGVNVNITLLFALQAYEKVAWAYVQALERRGAEGKDVHRIASVASFFVSRIDTLADKLLDDKIKAATDPQQAAHFKSLQGRAAIANAKLAYEKFQQIFSSDRFKALAAKGARVQRPLWASTSTKNPNYPATLYVDTLIGPDTINTLPLETIEAFLASGTVARTVDQDYAGAHETLRQLAEVGVHIDDVTKQVLDEGVVKFEDSLTGLLACIEAKRTALMLGRWQRERAVLGTCERAADETLAGLVRQNAAKKIWSKEPKLWSNEAEQGKAIKNRLGWLTVSRTNLANLGDITAFANEARDAGYTHAVLCGMGGSSLGAEVLQKTFGTQSGWLYLHVLDTTDPVTVSNLAGELDWAKALILIASKSGTTGETRAHLDYFYAQVSEKVGDKAGEHFAAITDPGTTLEAFAVEHHFRRVWSNPADIGGRYSVLSYFGLVPGALLGIDMGKLLRRAEEMRVSCEPCASGKENPGLWLGAIMGALARNGHDKVTLVTPDALGGFGAWVEQLLAESTGKNGRGLVPVAGETLGGPEVYGDDRLFVYLELEGTQAAETESRLAALQRAGHPIVRLHLRDLYDLGAEFFRWEFATAVAGAVLGLNPFDEPNVTESKENTIQVLAGKVTDAGKEGVLPFKPGAPFVASVAHFLRQARPGDYIAVMAYVSPNETNQASLQKLRQGLRDGLGVATTVGFGPRFLHSTGQLHKGGPNTVLALQITADRDMDAAVPGEPHTFGEFFKAQSLGDWQSLNKHGRRALRIQLKNEGQLAALAEMIKKTATETMHAKPARRGRPRKK